MSKASTGVASFQYLKAVFAVRDTISSWFKGRFMLLRRDGPKSDASITQHHHHHHHHNILFSVCLPHMQSE